MTKNLMSIHQIFKSKKIYWIGTYKTVLKYVSSDYIDIFQPIVKGRRTAKRYFVKEENINKFIKKFENNELV